MIIEKKFPDNPDLTKITNDTSGDIKYILSDSSSQTDPIIVFQYSVSLEKNSNRDFLGAGGFASVFSRRNPTADLAIKVLREAVSPDLIDRMNKCYRFCYKYRILRYFNVPLFLTRTKQLQRKVTGNTLSTCAKTWTLSYKQTEGKRMFDELKAAFKIFAESYAHNDITENNIMFDSKAGCLVMVDFDILQDNYYGVNNVKGALARLEIAESNFQESPISDPLPTVPIASTRPIAPTVPIASTRPVVPTVPIASTRPVVPTVPIASIPTVSIAPTSPIALLPDWKLNQSAMLESQGFTRDAIYREIKRRVENGAPQWLLGNFLGRCPEYR